MPGLKFRRKQENTLTGYEKMLAGAEHYKTALGPLAGLGAREASKRATALLHDANARAARALNEQRVRAEAKYQEFDDRYRPELHRVREQVVGDYVPRAQKTWYAGNHAVTAALAAAAEAGRKEWIKAYPAVRAAMVTPTAPPKKKMGIGKVLLVVGVVGAGAAAGYTVYRQSRPVEDPWAPPADFSKAHYPTASDSDSSVVEGSVGGGDSGDVAASLGTSSTTAAGANATASDPKAALSSEDAEKKGDSAPQIGPTDKGEGTHRGTPGD